MRIQDPSTETNSAYNQSIAGCSAWDFLGIAAPRCDGKIPQ
jgi:hypothetical protein